MITILVVVRRVKRLLKPCMIVFKSREKSASKGLIRPQETDGSKREARFPVT